MSPFWIPNVWSAIELWIISMLKGWTFLCFINSMKDTQPLRRPDSLKTFIKLFFQEFDCNDLHYFVWTVWQLTTARRSGRRSVARPSISSICHKFLATEKQLTEFTRYSNHPNSRHPNTALFVIRIPANIISQFTFFLHS